MLLCVPFSMMSQKGVPDRGSKGTPDIIGSIAYEYMTLEMRVVNNKPLVKSFTSADGMPKPKNEYRSVIQGMNDLGAEGYQLITMEKSLNKAGEEMKVYYFMKAVKKKKSKAPATKEK